MFCRLSNIVALQIILNIFLIYSSGKEPHVFCVIIYPRYIRLFASPVGLNSAPLVQPPTGWTVVIAWYALIQHLSGLFYSPVRAVFTASALSTAYTSIKYCKAGIHQDLFSHCVIDFFVQTRNVSVSFQLKYQCHSRRNIPPWLQNCFVQKVFTPDSSLVQPPDS